MFKHQNLLIRVLLAIEGEYEHMEYQLILLI